MSDTNLFKIRRAAGFRSARKFAQEIGMVNTTYSRYEREPLHMPVEQAIIIADYLGCSLDALYERSYEEPEEEEARLSPSSQKMLEEYMAYLRFRDHVLANRTI